MASTARVPGGGLSRSASSGFLDDQPAFADPVQVQRFATGDGKCISTVILSELGYSPIAIDRDHEVLKFDVDA